MTDTPNTYTFERVYAVVEERNVPLLNHPADISDAIEALLNTPEAAANYIAFKLLGDASYTVVPIVGLKNTKYNDFRVMPLGDYGLRTHRVLTDYTDEPPTLIREHPGEIEGEPT